MDVDLSNQLGRQQTGPGMSQNIRIAQQRQSIPSFSARPLLIAG